jgi:hypothetical protein
MKPQISNFIKIRPFGAEMLHADGQQTDVTKLVVAFRNFANAPKTRNYIVYQNVVS